MHKMLAQGVWFLKYTLHEEILHFLWFEPVSFNPMTEHKRPVSFLFTFTLRLRPTLQTSAMAFSFHPCGLPHRSSTNERGRY